MSIEELKRRRDELNKQKVEIDKSINETEEKMIELFKEKYPSYLFTINGFAKARNKHVDFIYKSKIYFANYEDTRKLLEEKGDSQKLENHDILFQIVVVSTEKFNLTDFENINKGGNYFYYEW